MNGFTTMRDLETEGAMYADVDVKTAINRGIIPGPRLFVATRSFSATGTYPLLGYSWELKMPEGVQFVDGADNIRRAVREQVKYGADWIKYYSDRKYYVKDGALPLLGQLHRRGSARDCRRIASPGTEGGGARHGARRHRFRAARRRGHHRARRRPGRSVDGSHDPTRRLLVPDHLRRGLCSRRPRPSR